MKKPDETIEKYNAILIARITKSSLLLLLYFSTMAVLESAFDLKFFGGFARSLIPTIDRMSSMSPIGDYLSASLGNGILLSPVGALYFCWHDALNERFNLAFRGKRSGMEKTKTFLFIYGVAVPILLFLIFAACNIPNAILVGSSTNFGAGIIHLLMNSKMAIVLIGPLTAVGMALFIYIVIIAFIGPFLKNRELT